MHATHFSLVLETKPKTVFGCWLELVEEKKWTSLDWHQRNVWVGNNKSVKPNSSTSLLTTQDNKPKLPETKQNEPPSQTPHKSENES